MTKHIGCKVMVTTGGTNLKDDIMRLYEPGMFTDRNWTFSMSSEGWVWNFNDIGIMNVTIFLAIWTLVSESETEFYSNQLQSM